MIMKRQNSFMLLASVMLVAMNLASCKMSNKPAAEISRIGEIPEAAQYIVGIEKFDSVIDYGFFFNNFKQNVADRIAAFLNKRGYLTVGGKPFTRETIRQMLTNPIYIGMIAYGRIGSSSQLLFTGKHQPIVSRHLWDQVQTLRAERRSRKSTDE